VRAETYTAFSQDIHARAVAQRMPLNGTIEVTRRCPLTCAHCYNNLPMGDGPARRDELTYDEHCRILDEIGEAGCLWLLFTGGEIFARKDFLDIYTAAKTRGFIVTLFTNGTLIDERVADHLARWPPFSIEITLYGRTKETYERLTGVPGSFERCMQGIARLRERGLPLKLKTVAVTVNQHEVDEMKRFAEGDLGVGFKLDAMMNPRIDGSAAPLGVRLSPADVVALDLGDPQRMKEWAEFSARYTTPPKSGDDLYQCGGAVGSFAIDPYGQLSLCVLSEVDKINLREHSFRHGWDEFLGKIRRRKITRITKCTACAIKSICGMCPANGELHGDAESPVDFLCEVAHLRAHAIGVAVPPHGTCEYCEGGASYAAVVATVASLREGHGGGSPRRAGLPPAPRRLPVLGSAPSAACGSGGCSSCH